jgi:hypothetical protein
MAIEKVINIVANTKEATREIGVLFDTLLDAELATQKLNKTAEKTEDVYKDTSKEAVKSVDKIGKSAENQSRVMQKLNNTVKAVGTSLKALGIGVIIALVAKFTEVLSSNQKVVDAFNTVSTTASIVINQLFGAFTKIAGKISDATGGFDALGKVVGGVVKIAFNGLKLVVLDLQLGFTALKLAYEKVFGSDEGVEKAKKDLTDISKKILETVTDTAKQGKTIISNVGEAVSEVVTGVKILATDGVKAIQDVDVKGAYAQAKALTQSKKNFELLALQQQRLQLSYQFQAEALRQVRDDETKSIADRIKANNELGEIVKKQANAESATIKARISAVQQEQNLLGVTAERTNEIYQLNTDLIDVAERLKGVQSEQLVNTNSLLKEQIELQKLTTEGVNNRLLAQMDFDASIEKNEDAKIQKQRERLDKENQLILDDIEQKRLLFKEGTLARAEAEQEFLDKEQEIKNKRTQLEIDEENLTKQRQQEAFNRQRELEATELSARQAFEDAKYNIADQTLNLIGGLAGKSKAVAIALLAVEKGLAISQVVTNSARAIAQATANLAAVPAVIGVVPNPMFAVQASATAKGIATTKLSAGLSIANILAQGIGQLKGSANLGGGDSGGGASATPTPPPAFNIVAGTGSNQIAQGLANQTQPLQAYVVGSAVTSQQELDRNAISTAKL